MTTHSDADRDVVIGEICDLLFSNTLCRGLSPAFVQYVNEHRALVRQREQQAAAAQRAARAARVMAR